MGKVESNLDRGLMYVRGKATWLATRTHGRTFLVHQDGTEYEAQEYGNVPALIDAMRKVHRDLREWKLVPIIGHGEERV